MENIEGRKAEFEEKKAELKQEGQQIRTEARDALRTIGEDASHWSAMAMRDFSQAVRKTADELQSRQYTRSAPAIRAAADRLEKAGQSLENADFSQFFRGATQFAKRSPQAFIGVTALCGFAAGRFLRSSSKSYQQRRTTSMSEMNRETSGQTGQGYSQGFSGGMSSGQQSYGGGGQQSYGGGQQPYGGSPGQSGVIPPIS